MRSLATQASGSRSPASARSQEQCQRRAPASPSGPSRGTLRWRRLRRSLREYALLTRLHRPIGTLLLLWPALWALWLAAGGVPDLGLLAIFLVGTLLMRSAGCVINDFADRDFDPYVARTRDRPLAARRVLGM